MVRDDVLVRGHDRFAGTERRRDERSGGLVATHQFDDDIRFGIGDQMGRRVRQPFGRDAARPGCREVSTGHTGQGERGAVGSGQSFRELEQRTDHLTADGPGAEDTDTQRRAAHRGTPRQAAGT